MISAVYISVNFYTYLLFVITNVNIALFYVSSC